MNDIASKFTIYETLRIVLPGTYGTTMLVLFHEYFIQRTNVDLGNVHYLIVFVFLSFLLGVFIYSLDLPKKLSFLQDSLPSNKIRKSFPNLSTERILNAYFDFYDNLSAEHKQKTEIFSGLYHFCVNITTISLCLAIYFRIFRKDFAVAMVEILNLSVLILALLSALALYSTRLKIAFNRNYEKFLASSHFQLLIQKKK